MALVGGGGSPNVSGGANPAGVGTSLNVIGNHIYGSNKVIVSQGVNKTFFDHSNGNYYALVNIAAGRNMKASSEVTVTIILNGETNYYAKLDNDPGNTLVLPFAAPMQFLIPPNSRFQLKFLAEDADAEIGAIVTGRVYA